MIGNVRRSAAASALALFATAAAAQAEDRALDTRLRTAFEAGDLPGLHAVIVEKDGETLAESYFPGADERWGAPLGVRDHGPDTLHDLRSVTKSVVGLLYGVALAEAKAPDLDAPLLDHFPQYADLAADPARRAVLVRHALSMTMGTAWDESLPYTDPANSEVAMETAPDRYRFALDRPMVDAPGTRWVYNGGAVALLAKLIEDGVGEPIDAYARRKLFAPLGVTDFEWVRSADGAPSAASGLRLRARDLARLGRLVLQGGAWRGAQIVPAAWLEASFAPRAEVEGDLRYGYLWWLAGWGEPPAWVAGFGNGGQRLTVQPAHGLVVVVLAGNYNRPDAWRIPVGVIEGFVVPALKDAAAP